MTFAISAPKAMTAAIIGGGKMGGDIAAVLALMRELPIGTERPKSRVRR